jgi:hypothetical protein
MTTTNNFSIHDDITARVTFFAINLVLYFICLKFTATTEYIYVGQFGTAVFLLAALVCFSSGAAAATKTTARQKILDALLTFNYDLATSRKE